MTRAWVLRTTAAVILVVVFWATPGAATGPLPGESFLYQIRNADPTALAQSPYRIIILDPTRDGSLSGDWTPQEIADLKAAGKIVLAVLRIGEAETSRFYWDPNWIAPETPELWPAWLDAADPERAGIYSVRYWHPGWQQILFGNPNAVVDRALAQGFDGFVLEAVDAYLYWGPDGDLPSSTRNDNAASDMISLIAAIAGYARAKTGDLDFPIVPQNGAALAASDEHIATLSGILVESTWFVADKRQKTRLTRTVVPYLDRVRAAGKPVFAIDYPQADRNIDTFYDRAESKGYIPLVTSAERDVLILQPRHPPGLEAAFTPQSPAPNADAYTGVIPQFVWSDSSLGNRTYRIRFSGSDARQLVFTFPKTGVLTGLSYTPRDWEWRSVLRLARSNPSGIVYWWITTTDSSNVTRSSEARVLYRMHGNIPTTMFWIGAAPGEAGADSRATSAWDADWLNHFGGVDDPTLRNPDPLHPYWPFFTPLENPFYVALPYNDFTDSGLRRLNFAKVVPWAPFRTYGPLDSAVKNHWVKITHNDQTCYAQWEDVGPVQTYDFRYVFGVSKPRNQVDPKAGLEVSPAVRDCLTLGDGDVTHWRFVYDDEILPDGPWNEVVTTSQITPLP